MNAASYQRLLKNAQELDAQRTDTRYSALLERAKQLDEARAAQTAPAASVAPEPAQPASAPASHYISRVGAARQLRQQQAAEIQGNTAEGVFTNPRDIPANIRDAAIGAVQTTGAGIVNAAGTGLDMAYNTARGNWQQQEIEDAQRNIAGYEEAISRLNPNGKNYASRVAQMNALIERERARISDAQSAPEYVRTQEVKVVQDVADRLRESGETRLSAAKDRAGVVGDVLIDAGASAPGMAVDALVNAAIPGAGLASLAVRSFGSGAQTARLRGADLGRQTLYGIADAAKEVATEMISGATFKSVYSGKQTSIDDVIQKATERLIRNETLQKLAQGFVGEGFEEIVATMVEPLVEAIIDEGAALSELKTEEGRLQYIRDVLYSGIVGGVMGAFGQGGQIVGQNVRQRFQTSGAGADLRNAGVTQNLIDAARSLEGTEAARMAEEIGDKPTDIQLGRLYEQIIEDAMAQDAEAATEDAQAEEQAAQTAEQAADASRAAQSVLAREITPDDAPAAPAANLAASDYGAAADGLARSILNGRGIEATNEAVAALRGELAGRLATEEEYSLSDEDWTKRNDLMRRLSERGTMRFVRENFSETQPELQNRVAYYTKEDNTMHVNRLMSSAAIEAATIKHELTHSLERTKAYQRLRRLIRDGYAGDEAYQRAISDVIEDRAAKGEALTREDAELELIADKAAELLSDDVRVRRIVADDRTFAQKLLDAIRDFLDGAGRANNPTVRRMRQAEKALADALREKDAENKRAAPKRSVNQQILEEQTGRKNGEQSLDATESAERRKAEKTREDGQFSGDTILETKGDLVALHNLSEAKLQKALKLGGFPMPSIAVTKKDIPHTNFGNITLVMNRSTIDPQQSRKNTVYSADAWTPTFPQVEYEVNEKVAEALRRRYYDLYRKHGDKATRPLYPWANYADDELTRVGGEEKIIERALDDTDMMKLFLLDRGLDVPAPITEESVNRLDDDTIRFYDHFIKALGEDTFKELAPQEGKSPLQVRKEWWAAHGEAFEDAYRAYMADLGGFTEEQMENVLKNETVASQTSKAIKMRNYILNGPETRTVTENTSATNDAIRAAVDGDAYSEWLRDLFGGIEKSSGIYNGRERYTPSGNLRSFRQTHVPVTLENIAEAMSNENGGNSRNVSGFYGVKSLRAGMAKRFSSIKEMHEYEGRLRHLSADEAQQITDALQERLSSVINRILDTGKRGETDNVFIAMDRIGDNLMEITEASKITPERIQTVMRKYGYNVDDALAQDIRALLFDIGEMPVNIFEAKPERPVRFDEVLAAIVPNGTSAEVVKALQERGVDVMTYEGGDEAARMRAVNSVPNAQFSGDTIDAALDENAARAAAADYRRAAQKLEGAYDTEQELADARKEIKYLSEKLAYWKQQTKLTKTPTLDEKAVRRQAREMLKAYGATDQSLAADMSELYGEMARGEIGFSEAHDRAIEIAKDMVDSIAVRDTAFSDQYKELTEELRSNPIVLSRTTANGIDNFEELRKKHFGRVPLRVVDRVTTETALDQRYQELAERYPELFSPEDADAETQLLKIFDAVEQIAQSKEIQSPFDNDVEGAEAVANDVANEILERFFDVPQVKTAADRLLRRQMLKTAKMADRMRERNEAKIEKLLQKQQEVKDHNKEMRVRERTRRQESADRQKTLRIARRLANVKTTPELRSMIDELTKGIDLLGVGILEKGYTRSDGVVVNGRLELKELAEDYALRAANDENFIANKALETVLFRYNKKQLADMSIEDVRELYRSLLEIDHQIRTYNKEVGIEHARTFRALAGQAIQEVSESKGTGTNSLANFYAINSLRPETFFAQLAGYKTGAVSGLYQQLQDGQTKMLDYTMKATSPFDAFTKEHKRDVARWSGKNSEVITLRAADGKPILGSEGKPVQFTPSMRISLYLHLQNDQNMAHIAFGGIRVPDMAMYKQGKIQEAYDAGQIVKLTKEEIRAITSQMTQAEKDFAALAHGYFNGISKEWINETSLALDGYELAQVENYFPIVSDNRYGRVAISEGLVYDGTIEGQGWTKERQNAKNPILLEDADAIIPRHIDGVSRYVGLAAPIRNVNDAMRWQVKDGERTATLTDTIAQKYPKVGNEYIKKLVRDLQFPYKPDAKWAKRLRGNYAAAVLNFNPAVALGQAASYPTAAEVLGWRALGIGLKMRPAKVELIAKYTPLLWYRSQGYVDTDLGNIKNYGGTFAQIASKLPGSKWIQRVDLMTVRQLWNASEAWVRLNTDLEKGTDAYYRKTAEMFNKTVYQTQPNYTALQRPQMLRSDSEIERSIFMFATQRMQNYNMLYQSLGAMGAAKRSGNRAAFGAAAARGASTALTLLIANSVYTAMRNAVRYGLLRKDEEEWVNEEGQSTWANGLVVHYWQNMAGSLPLASEAYEAVSAIASAANGKLYDTFSVPALETINGLVRDAQYFAIELSKLMSSGYPHQYLSQNPKFFKYAKQLSMDISQMYGVPIQNVEKYTVGILKQVNPYLAKRYENMFAKPTKQELDAARTPAQEKAVFEAITETRAGTTSEKLYELWKQAGIEEVDGYIMPELSKEFSVDKVKHVLNAKEYAEANAVYADTISAHLDALIDKTEKMDGVRRSKTISGLYTYARNKALHSVNSGFKLAKWVEEAEICVEGGISLADVLAYKAEAEYRTETRNKAEQPKAWPIVEDYIDGLKLTQKQKIDLFETLTNVKDNPFDPYD